MFCENSQRKGDTNYLMVGVTIVLPDFFLLLSRAIPCSEGCLVKDESYKEHALSRYIFLLRRLSGEG